MEIVEIKVERLFLVEFRKCVAYALSEFGRKTVKNWNAEYEKIRHRLEMMPTGYPFVPELQKWQKYRGAIIMKNFKIIYFYDEDSNLVRIVDLWDLRQDPRKLNMRARRIERKKGLSLVFMINKRTRQVSQRILHPVEHLAGCLFEVVFYKDSSTSFQSINPLPVSSSSTARAMTLRLSALNGSV